MLLSTQQAAIERYMSVPATSLSDKEEQQSQADLADEIQVCDAIIMMRMVACCVI